MKPFPTCSTRRLIARLLLLACVATVASRASSSPLVAAQEAPPAARPRPVARVLLIPIDDRPAVTQFAEWIGRIADAEVVMPPAEMLGTFARGGDPERIIAWLRGQNPSDFDAAIISVDMLAYGGLIRSRTSATPLDLARRRLDSIGDLRRRAPRLPVYAFNAVQRVALSGVKANRAYRDRLARWVVLAHQTTLEWDAQLKAEFDRLTNELPPGVIEDYRRTRARNLQINFAALDLVKAKQIDELLLLQDDALPYGLHRLDQQALREQIARLALTDAQAKLYNGADEGASVLLSRAVLRRHRHTPRVRVVYSSEAGKRAVGTYEDQPIERSVERQLAASGARLVENDDADYTLYVNAPATDDGEFDAFAARLISDVKAGAPVAVADIRFDKHWGGSDTRLIDRLKRERLLDRLAAYASWNTPGNTLGTAIPQANLYTFARSRFADDARRAANCEQANIAFLLHRYIGDYAYHTRVRPEINRYARRDLKIDTDELDAADYTRLDRLVRERLTLIAREIFTDNFAGHTYRTTANAATRVRAMSDPVISLPWSRTFEVDTDFALDFIFADAHAGAIADQPQTTNQQPSTASDADEARWIEETLKPLSLRERIGQLIVTAASSEYMNFDSERFAGFRRDIVEHKVGGVIVRQGSPNEVASVTNEFQRLAKVPLLIAADYERGLRMQMKNGTPFTTNMGVGAAGDPAAAFAQGRIIAEEMRAIGVNWLFAPVADINNNPENPVINIRSFGEDPQRVAEFVQAAVRGVRAGGALATVKHFPGHGDTATDSHIGLATIKVDRARLDKVELVPFRAAIAAGVDAVMTAHVAVPAVTGDGLPSTLSSKITTNLLRRELGFDGIIITDSLGMGAITKGFPGGEAAVRAIRAGADVALLTPDPRSAIEAIEAAVKRGEISPARIDESVRRLLRAKYQLGLARNRFVDTAAVNRLVERRVNMTEADRIAERSITLLRNRDSMLPLDPTRAARTLFVVVAADTDAEEGRTFIPQVERRAKGAQVIRIDPRTTAPEFDAALARAAAAESIVVATFVKRAALKGTVALPEAQAAFVRELVALHKPVAVVAFGSPYLVRQFENAQVYVAAYAIEDVAQAAAVRALFGETEINGRLPVRVPGLFEVGVGIRVAPRATQPVQNAQAIDGEQ